MEKTIKLRGLSTVTYWAEDLKAARKWYTEALGIDPYFVRPDAENPSYIEFRLGDYLHELGIIDSKYAPKGTTKQSSGAIAYWHVDDLELTLKKLLALGASEHAPITEHGPGFVTASVIDPFGNVFGVMYNQHYLDILAKTKK